MNEELDINILETTFNNETFETAVSKRQKHYSYLHDIFYYLKNNCFPESYLDKKPHHRTNLKRESHKFVIANDRLLYRKKSVTQKIEPVRGVCETAPPGQWKEGVHYLKKETQEVKEKEVVMDHKQALELVRSSHESTGHHGRNVMRLYLNGYHIYRLEDMIKLFKVCSSCEQYKRFCPDEIEFHPIVSGYAFERLHMDVTYPKELKENGRFTKYLAVAADHFSGKVWTKVIQNRDAKSMAAFYKDIIAEVGIAPSLVHVDKGTENKADFKEAVLESGAQYITSATRHPQSNGAVERPNGILKPNISRMLNESPAITYESATQVVTAQYNSRHNTVIRLKPDDAFMYGLMSNPTYFETNKSKLSLDDMSRSREIVLSILTEKAKRSEIDRRKRSKSVPIEKLLKQGDEVWVKMKNPKTAREKLKYKGTITKRFENGRVSVMFTTKDGGPRGEIENKAYNHTYLLSEVCKTLSLPPLNEPPVVIQTSSPPFVSETPVISRKDMKRRKRMRLASEVFDAVNE